MSCPAVYLAPVSLSRGENVSTIRAEEIARRLLQALPSSLAGLDQDLRRNIRATLVDILQRMDLVSREEFDVQAAVLARSRERLEQLETRVKALEAQIEASPPT